jgi:hypothetical protein
MLKSKGDWPNDMAPFWENRDGWGKALPGTPGVLPMAISMDRGDWSILGFGVPSDSLLFFRERDLRGTACCGVGERLAKKSSTLWRSGF